MQYYTARQLIAEAFRYSGQAQGSVPDDVEVTDALNLLNGFLETYSLEPLWSSGVITRTVIPKGDGTIVVANDRSRVITNANAAMNAISITTADRHGLTVGESISIKLPVHGLLTATISAVVSIYEFVLGDNPTASSWVETAGVWKRVPESDRYLIDLVLDPPVNFTSVRSSEALPEIYQDEYFNSTSTPFGWSWVTSFDPYPYLWCSEGGPLVLSLPEPGYANITLNTDISKWPNDMRQVCKWRLAADLAQINGFLEVSAGCLARYHEAFDLWKRSRRRAGDAIGDCSAPGVGGGRYDISTDSYR